MSGITNGDVLPQIRILKCPRCGFRHQQRMNKFGRFDKVKDCMKCGHEKMETLRILTRIPG